MCVCITIPRLFMQCNSIRTKELFVLLLLQRFHWCGLLATVCTVAGVVAATADATATDDDGDSDEYRRWKNVTLKRISNGNVSPLHYPQISEWIVYNKSPFQKGRKTHTSPIANTNIQIYNGNPERNAVDEEAQAKKGDRARARERMSESEWW